jgi:hypothetical protein
VQAMHRGTNLGTTVTRHSGQRRSTATDPSETVPNPHTERRPPTRRVATDRHIVASATIRSAPLTFADATFGRGADRGDR